MGFAKSSFRNFFLKFRSCEIIFKNRLDIFWEILDIHVSVETQKDEFKFFSRLLRDALKE